MTYSLYHFREAEEILQGKELLQHLEETLRVIEQDLIQSSNRGHLLRFSLDYMGWRDQDRRILARRRYAYKGLCKRAAIEANLSNYEWILDGLFRLQVGLDQGIIDVGVLLLGAPKGEENGDGQEAIVREDVESLYPSISLPVTVVLFDFNQVAQETMDPQSAVAPHEATTPEETPPPQRTTVPEESTIPPEEPESRQAAA